MTIIAVKTGTWSCKPGVWVQRVQTTRMPITSPFSPASYSSRDYISSRDTRDYAPPPRDYAYRDYPHSSSRDEYGSVSRSYRYGGLQELIISAWHWTKKANFSFPSPTNSDRDGYGGSREPRGYIDRPSGGSYRDPYDGYGKIKLCFSTAQYTHSHKATFFSNPMRCSKPWDDLKCIGCSKAVGPKYKSLSVQNKCNYSLKCAPRNPKRHFQC